MVFTIVVTLFVESFYVKSYTPCDGREIKYCFFLLKTY